MDWVQKLNLFAMILMASKGIAEVINTGTVHNVTFGLFIANTLFFILGTGEDE